MDSSGEMVGAVWWCRLLCWSKYDVVGKLGHVHDAEGVEDVGEDVKKASVVGEQLGEDTNVSRMCGRLSSA